MAVLKAFSKNSLERYLNFLAAPSACPGGGSAAALTAALGTALFEMAAGINGKRELKKTGKINPNAQMRIKKIKNLRSSFLTLSFEDAKAFLKIQELMKEDKKSAAFQKALKNAAKVPFKICELSSLALGYGLEEKNRTSPWLASDLAEGAILLEAAFESAWLNVEINLKSITDKKFNETIRGNFAQLKNELKQNKRNLMGVLAN